MAGRFTLCLSCSTIPLYGEDASIFYVLDESPLVGEPWIEYPPGIFCQSVAVEVPNTCDGCMVSQPLYWA